MDKETEKSLYVFLESLKENKIIKVLRQQNLISNTNELIGGERAISAISLICGIISASVESGIIPDYNQFELEWVNNTPYVPVLVFSSLKNDPYNAIIPVPIFLTTFFLDDIELTFTKNLNVFISLRYIKVIPIMMNDNGCELDNKLNHKKEFKTYLMIDKNTGFYKIGKAIEPYFREKTLQSEKPTISILAFCDKNIENYLHKKYAIKKIRGEWYNLSEKEVSEVISEFINQN